jgi:hypothetical protein
VSSARAFRRCVRPTRAQQPLEQIFSGEVPRPQPAADPGRGNHLIDGRGDI